MGILSLLAYLKGCEQVRLNGAQLRLALPSSLLLRSFVILTFSLTFHKALFLPSHLFRFECEIFLGTLNVAYVCVPNIDWWSGKGCLQLVPFYQLVNDTRTGSIRRLSFPVLEHDTKCCLPMLFDVQVVLALIDVLVCVVCCGCSMSKPSTVCIGRLFCVLGWLLTRSQYANRTCF